MPEEPTGQQGGAHDSPQDFIQHMIWRLESERDGTPNADQEAYNALIQRWERIVLDTPLSTDAQALLEAQVFDDQWIFATPVEFGDGQYTADIPMLPVHVSVITKEEGGKQKRYLSLMEAVIPVEMDRKNINHQRGFELPLDDEEGPTISRIVITPPKNQ